MNTRVYIGQIDLDAVIRYNEIIQSVGWESRGLQVFRKSLENSLMVVTAFMSGDVSANIIGAGRIVGDQYSATLFDLVVDPDFQKQGVGKAILQRMQTELQVRGIDRLYCFADNETSVKYYVHGGWRGIEGFVWDLGRQLHH